LKNVRIFYTKGSRMRFVSHLDMTRFMTRMLRKAKLPIWYTEGFHPHAYITFALPLSLGFESDYEIMDIRLNDDDYPIQDICDKLNAVFPEYVHAFCVAEPVQKVGKIGFAQFEITFQDNGLLLEALKEFLARNEIKCLKKTKKGAMKEIDIAPKIVESRVEGLENTTLYLTLPAGGEDNVNPELLLNAFFEQSGQNYYCYLVRRIGILNTEKEIFK